MVLSRILFIVNPAAGAGRGLTRWRQFKPQLPSLGRRLDERIIAAPGEALPLARELATNYELIVAAGGDGLAHEAATGILSSKNPACALAVVPTGTGNDFGAALGITDLRSARQALTEGTCLAMDVIQLDCMADGKAVTRFALLFAGVGIASECLRGTTPWIKRICGERLAYPVGLIRALWSYRAPLLRVTCDGRTEGGRFLFIGASNTECAGGGMKLAPGACVTDGRLNITLVESLGRWQALLQVRRLCRGQHVGHPRVHYFTGQRLEIESATPLEVAADGELVGQTPAQFKSLPRALNVLRLGSPPGW